MDFSGWRRQAALGRREERGLEMSATRRRKGQGKLRRNGKGNAGGRKTEQIPIKVALRETADAMTSTLAYADHNHGHSSGSRQREERHRSTFTRATEVFDQPSKSQYTLNPDRRNSTTATHGQASTRTEKNRSSEKRSRKEERPYASDHRSSYVNGVNDTKSPEAGPASAGRRSFNRRPIPFIFLLLFFRH